MEKGARGGESHNAALGEPSAQAGRPPPVKEGPGRWGVVEESVSHRLALLRSPCYAWSLAENSPVWCGHRRATHEIAGGCQSVVAREANSLEGNVSSPPPWWLFYPVSPVACLGKGLFHW